MKIVSKHKIDEYILCKKNFHIFKEGYFYKIENISTNQVYLNCLYNGMGIHKNGFKDEICYIVEGSDLTDSILNQFFYTTKEIRKLKLEKIYENRRF